MTFSGTINVCKWMREGLSEVTKIISLLFDRFLEEREKTLSLSVKYLF